MRVEGVVEVKARNGYGLKVSGRWINFRKSVSAEKVNKIQVGDEITAEIDDKGFIKHIEINSKFKERTKSYEEIALKQSVETVFKVFMLKGLSELTESHLNIINTLLKFKLWNGKL